MTNHADLERAGSIFVDPGAYADPERWHRDAALLRRESPVHRIEADGFEPFYAVTRHADLVEIEKQHDKFLNTIESVLLPIDEQDRRSTLGVDLRTLIHMDGDEHRAYRKVTNDWFKPANLRRTVEGRVDELARAYVDRMAAMDGACDFARDVALYYPLHVIMSILGVPESDEPLMLKLTQQLFGSEDPEFSGDDRAETMIQAVMEFAAYYDTITKDRRANPKDDVASTIANGTVDGEPLGDLQTASYYTILATAGHDTTSGTLIAGLDALMANRDQLADVRNDPSLIDNAVEEMIRWATPVRHFMRHATEDYELAGVRLRAGDRLLMSYLSANRDERVFDDPFRFDIRRDNAAEQLGFGVGVHFCLGAHLARMELRAFFRELLPRLETIEPAGPTDHVQATFVGGIKRLPIRYRMTAA